MTNVIAIGIGGSFLGPLFVHTALQTGYLDAKDTFTSVLDFCSSEYNHLISNNFLYLCDIANVSYIMQTQKLLDLQAVGSCICKNIYFLVFPYCIHVCVRTCVLLLKVINLNFDVTSKIWVLVVELLGSVLEQLSSLCSI